MSIRYFRIYVALAGAISVEPGMQAEEGPEPGVGHTSQEAIANIDDGNGPDMDQPVRVVSFMIEMSEPILDDGGTVKVPDAPGVVSIQSEKD